MTRPCHEDAQIRLQPAARDAGAATAARRWLSGSMEFVRDGTPRPSVTLCSQCDRARGRTSRTMAGLILALRITDGNVTLRRVRVDGASELQGGSSGAIPHHAREM